MSAPLIAVTSSRTGTRTAVSFCRAALWVAGARVRVLRPPYRPERLSGLCGVVIGGGVHIEPARYAEQPSATYRYQKERDELEWQVLEHAAAHALPVLGICRGAQLLNVFRGGILYQDLAREFAGLALERSVRASKSVEIEPDSTLAHVVERDALRVNSLHQQAIRTLGRGLRICARDRAGIVQAIEGDQSNGQAVLGVQWHPEYLLDAAPQRRLFRWVVQEASKPV
ncbi:MAG TPA: gamma-glutamyl-gamma-aminobutyrate hydrolase family protein [Polyangiales bacterium]|nr:gamma-glutamyl-gamma-aminobutyrate hydrolase family protein [Polyangiales bacterium]